MPRILIADDDVTTAMEMEAALKTENYDVVGCAYSGEEAVEMALSLTPDLILMDIVMPGLLDGIAAAQEIRSKTDAGVVFITGYGDRELVERAKYLEPFGYIMKPYHPKEIRATVEIALYKKGLERKLQEAHSELEQKVADQTSELTRVNEQLHALMNATSDTAVLMDLDGKVIAANAIAAKRFGMRLDKFIGARVYDLMPPDLARVRKSKINRVIDTGKTLKFKDKRNRIIFESQISPVFNQNGEVVQLAVYGKDITKWVDAYEGLEQSKKDLESKTGLLEEANIALKMMLQKSTENRKEVEEEILTVLKKRIVPYISKMKQYELDNKLRDCIDILESNLRDIVSPFSRKMSFEYINLSPKEIQVANLIRQGRSTKDISQILNLTKGTVEVHRNNIRKKLDLKNKKVNLKAYLMSLR